MSQDYTGTIAIVGMAGRFPGARSIDQFWQNLSAGVRSIQSFSPEELLGTGVDPAVLENPQYVRARGVLDAVDQFDATFFGFSEAEARQLDPQQRLFLECAWEALEQAGYNPWTYPGRIGIFAGMSPSTYPEGRLRDQADGVTVGARVVSTGYDHDSLPLLVATQLNLRGPRVTLQTGCATSLVAVHLACQSLLNRACHMALAGGVTIALPQERGYLYQEGGMLSPDGFCRAFDRQAQGGVVGNGVGVVVLKRMEEALADGDYVYAVIRGSMVTSVGLHTIGVSPSELVSQATVIAQALQNANVKPEQVSYIETHGSGTAFGDAIELAALLKVFQAETQKRHFCALGTVKPNVGHLDQAGGIVGLMKTALALTYKQLPPLLHFERLSSDIDLTHSPFYINTKLSDWPVGVVPRCAGVSAFGGEGTNVHVVMEEAPVRPSSDRMRPYHLLVLSAKSATALEMATTNLVAHCRRHPDMNPADLAYTLQVGRAAFPFRRTLVFHDLADAIAMLEMREPQRVLMGETTRHDRPLVFMFADRGGMASGITYDLYQHEPIFRVAIDQCAELLLPHLGFDLRTILYPYDKELDYSDRADWIYMRTVQASRIASFVVAYALARLLMSWGVKPQAVIGEGIGTYVAACVTEALTLADGLRLIVTQVRDEPDNRVVTIHQPRIPFVSPVAGTWLTAETVSNPMEWAQTEYAHTRFAEGLALLLREPGQVLLEVGLGRALSMQLTMMPELVTFPETLVLPTFVPIDGIPSELATLTSTLGRLWQAGVTINWQDLYANEQRYRQILPTYPFERSSYWLQSDGADSITGSHDDQKQADVGSWFSIPVWKQSVTPVANDLNASITKEAPWLIFQDDVLGPQLVARLATVGCHVVTVNAGQQFRQSDLHTFTINPNSLEDYRQLLVALPIPPRMIIHLWSLNAPPATSFTPEYVEEVQRHSLYSVLTLVHALGDQMYANDLTIWCITRNVHRVTGVEDVAPEQAILHGASLVIGQEYLNIRCRVIDVDTPRRGSWQEQVVVDHLLEEFVAPVNDVAVAYRGSERWACTYEPVHVDVPVFNMRLRQHGVYMLVGGLEPSGLVLAEHLARTMQARLVLTTPEPFPSATEWETWLSNHDSEDPISQVIRMVQTCVTLGGEVLVRQVDPSDEAMMYKVFTQAEQQFGRLQGVIYIAGSQQQSIPLQYINREECERYFRSKVYGLATLERIVGEQALDFCIIFSSLTSVLGGLGMALSSATNRFVDAFVQRHNQLFPRRWIGVNWDRWNLEKPSTQSDYFTYAYGMRGKEALQAFERVLANTPVATQLIVASGNLERRVAQWVQMTMGRTLAGRSTLQPRPVLTTPYAGPTNESERIIATIWQAVLGIEVGIHDNFMELGGNSFSAIQIIHHVRLTFNIHVPFTLVHEAPTVVQMVIAVERIRGGQIPTAQADGRVLAPPTGAGAEP